MKIKQYGATVLFFLFICGIILWADSGRGHDFFVMVYKFPMADKVGHASLYGMLTFLFTYAYEKENPVIRRIPYTAVAVLLFAIGEELTQAFLPNRSLDFFDGLADFVGITAGAWVARRLLTTQKGKPQLTELP